METLPGREEDGRSKEQGPRGHWSCPEGQSSEGAWEAEGLSVVELGLEHDASTLSQSFH